MIKAEQLCRRAQPQHRERHAHRLYRLDQPVERAVGLADQRGRHGHIRRGQLVQRPGIQFTLRKDVLQAPERLWAGE